MRPNRLCAALVLCLAATCLLVQFASAGVFCAQRPPDAPPSIGFSAVPLKISERESVRAEKPALSQATSTPPPPLPVTGATAVPVKGQAPPAITFHVVANGIHAPPN